MLLSEKYCPTKLSLIAGNKDSVSRLKQWAMQFTLGKIQKPVLLFGPPGCGKSAAAKALASELEWQLVLINPPEEGGAEKWEKKLGASLSGSLLFGGNSIMLIEDADTWQKLGSRGSLPKLVSAIKEARVPVILTARDAYDRSISSLRSLCEQVQFKAINSHDVNSVLASIAKNEELEISTEDISKLTANAGGDLRAAINDLQAQNMSASREKQASVFENVRMCFRSQTYKGAKKLNLGSIMERDTLKLYVAENMPAELFERHDLAQGFERLSRSDVFDGRIKKNQYWGYLRYSSDLLVWGPSSARKHVRAVFIPYAFPSYIQKMGATKSRRAQNKALSLKISVRTHTTSKTARVYIPLICAQAAAFPSPSDASDALSSYYRFDEEEVAGILEIAPASIGEAPAGKKKGKQK